MSSFVQVMELPVTTMTVVTDGIGAMLSMIVFQMVLLLL